MEKAIINAIKLISAFHSNAMEGKLLLKKISVIKNVEKIRHEIYFEDFQDYINLLGKSSSLHKKAVVDWQNLFRHSANLSRVVAEIVRFLSRGTIF